MVDLPKASRLEKRQAAIGLPARFAHIVGLLRRVGIDLSDAELGRFGRLASASAAVQFVTAALGVATSILLARLLGAEGLGVYAAVFALISVVSVFTNTGVPLALVRLLPSHRVQDDRGRLGGCIAWAYGHVTVLSLVASGMIAILTLQFGWWDGPSRSTYLFAAAVLPALGVAAVQGGILRGVERIVAAQIPEGLIRPAAFTLFLAACFALDGNGGIRPQTAMALQVFASVLSVVAGAVLIRRFLPSRPLACRLRFDLGKWYRLALLLTSAGVTVVVMGQCALLILPLFTEPAEVGQFRVALAAATLIALPLVAVNAPLAPAIARLFAAGEKVQLQRLLTTSARCSLAVCLPIALACVFAGDWVLSVLFGAEFADAYPLLVVLVVGQIVNVGVGSVVVLLQMTGHERVAARGLSVAAGFQVLLTLIAAPTMGAIGAAVAHAAGLVLWNLILLLHVRKHLELNPTAVKVTRWH